MPEDSLDAIASTFTQLGRQLDEFIQRMLAVYHEGRRNGTFAYPGPKPMAVTSKAASNRRRMLAYRRACQSQPHRL